MVGHGAPPRGLATALIASVCAALAPIALTLGLSMAHVQITAGVAWGVVGLSLLVGVSMAVWTWRSHPRRIPSGSNPSPMIVRISAAVLLALCGLSALAQFLVLWRRPVLDWDGLYYHVPALHAWLRAGRIVWIDSVPDIPFVNGYPMGLETLGFLSVRLLGHDRLIDGGNLLMWPIAMLGTAFLADRWGATGPWRAIAAGGIVLAPAWLLLSTTAYVDVGFAAATFALFALSAWRLQGADQLPAAIGWGAAVGLAMSIKGPGIPLAMLATAVLLVDLALRPSTTRRRAALALVVGLVIAGSTGGLWPLRAYLHSGNPIHPIELRLGDKVFAEGYDPHESADLALPNDLRARAEPLRPLIVWTHFLRPVTSYDQPEGLGAVWTLGALPAIIWLALRRRRWEIIAILGLAATWLIAQPSPWWARFTIWILGIGLAALAVALSRAMQSNRRTLRVGVGLLALGIAGLGLQQGASALAADRMIGHDANGPVNSALEYWFAPLANDAQFQRALRAPKLGRTRWGRFGTLLGGCLSQPAGLREIVPVSSSSLDDVPADLKWVIWDLQGAPDLKVNADWNIAFDDRHGTQFILLRHRSIDANPG